jgi:glycosyltransferase involved in cell wall biosynthesis
MLNQITPVILTYNEAANIGRTLSALTWANDIVVVDSMSTDDTKQIVQTFKKARFIQKKFDAHAPQWNYAISETDIATDWILALDADYYLSDDLIAELKAFKAAPDVNAFRISFRYCVLGKSLKRTLYPPGLALFRKGFGQYIQEGHTQRFVVRGRIQELGGKIFHDDRKPLARWLIAQQNYARLEADHLLATNNADLGRTDRIRKMGWPAPILVFLYTLFARGCIFEGWHGWFYVLQRTLAEIMLALEIIDRRIGKRSSSSKPDQN